MHERSWRIKNMIFITALYKIIIIIENSFVACKECWWKFKIENRKKIYFVGELIHVKLILKFLESEEFLGKHEDRNIFLIEC